MSSRVVPIHGLDPEEKVEATLVWDGRSSPDFERDVCLGDLIHDFPTSIPYPRALWAPAHRALAHLPGLLRRAAIFLLPSFIQPLTASAPACSRGRATFAGDPRFLRNVRESPTTEPAADRHDDGAAGAGVGGQRVPVRARLGLAALWGPGGGGGEAMDVHLWTVPVEFRCSMVLFLTLLGTARLRRGWRFVVIGASVAFAYLSQRWELVLFYAGMVLAEMDVARSAHGHLGVRRILAGCRWPRRELCEVAGGEMFDL
ncbi:hypothetical protein MYCTH_2124971 [Thermothelomyces thermophilus ATCC 42464]|uniref:Uncharacterized protein n=1 Tax=Thermothelomyces thermophilus (strain ATCC 42464 / BCRC 31852 / DSM 1799) TaxID=573729 RepID=G2Q789_THET4|nr:uncharacterized protein MYCTH_2124971 [Thermothelomyces thermophilus ATCC 42464]AEO56000.1 hypothetical protein MYCTH_2124971 [Thermothelomyces thermophilus ATCC 42464]